jgi:hypothetical protein
MSCRSNAGNSAVTSLARLTMGLSDRQTLSVFHALVREGASCNLGDPSRGDVEEWLAEEIAYINRRETLTPTRRQSLINRLEQMRRPDAPLPNAATYYAWQHLQARTELVRTGLDQDLSYYARHLGLPGEEIRRQFDTDRAAADRDRRLTASDEFLTYRRSMVASNYNEQTDFIDSGYYPRDRTTLYALSRLHERRVSLQTQNTQPSVSGASSSASSGTGTGGNVTPHNENENEDANVRADRQRRQQQRLSAERTLAVDLLEQREASDVAKLVARAAADTVEAVAVAVAVAAALSQAQAQVEAASNPDPASASVASYGQDIAAFQRSYDAAKERKARGEAPVPYLRENATNGLGARDGGRGFGVEIEFDLRHLGEDEREDALYNIGHELYVADLTATAFQEDYHSAARDGNYLRWRFEEDNTVSGEIVSPILYDEPKTWERLEKVCEIVRRHGGKATTRTGSHVHVACGNYDHNPANHNNLLQLFKQNEDVLYRLAQNPEADAHRGTSYCAPNLLPARDYTDVAQVNRASQSNRYTGLNFQAVEGYHDDHVEFRMWDGTLDPAAIQSQIKMSLAMTEAAFRAEPGAFRDRNSQEPEPLGMHSRLPARAQARAEGRRELSGADWQRDTASFRNLVDTLFTRPEDKEQLTALFAVTKWQDG